jgi:hypothetical protein
MNRLTLIVARIACAVSSHHATAAQRPYSTDFENPPFIAGQPLIGQDDWANEIFMSSPLGLSAAISTSYPNSRLQSFQVDSADLTAADLASLDLGSYRQFVNFDAAADGMSVCALLTNWTNS